MAAALAAVTLAVGAAYLAPRGVLGFTKYFATPLGRFVGTWALIAFVYDLLFTADRAFNSTDAAITGLTAGVVRVVV